MAYAAKIILDSLSPEGHRLTSFEITLPRIVLAEFNTHRMFSRNSASSRAIPVEKMIRMVEDDPYVPESWGKNQKGMVAEEDLSPIEQQTCENVWLKGRDEAVTTAKRLLEIGVHKQLTNRLLEPFMWHTVLVTATEWSNFFNLRDNKSAHPAIQKPAAMMKELYGASRPTLLQEGQWHMPYVSGTEDELAFSDQDPAALPREDAKKVSSGRAARLSYLTHDKRRDLNEDVRLHDGLLTGGHMSPFEHVARPMTPEELDVYRMTHVVLEGGFRADTRTVGYQAGDTVMFRGIVRKVISVRTTHFCGNFDGWMQYRKEIPYEEDILASRAS